MNRLIQLTLVALTCLGMTSCLKEKREATYNAQESKIDSYINTNRYRNYTEEGVSMTDTLRVEYRGGASRLVLEEGIGEELQPDGTVSFHYAGYTFNGNKSAGNLFATNHEQTAKESGWVLTDFAPKTVHMKDNELIKGLGQGLIGVKSGEHCQILFSGKYGFGKKTVGTIPAESAILFEIWVEAVSNE